MSSLADALIPPQSHHSLTGQVSDIQDEGMADLFGQEEEEEQLSEPASPSANESERLPSPERAHRQALEYAEDDNPQDIPYNTQNEATVGFTNLPVPRSSDGNIWVLRLPNFVKLDSKPFFPETYMGPDDEETHNDSAREQSMTIKLKVENTIRWRWTKNDIGDQVPQTNSRVIRWSDGSLSLRLGKELFDISESVDTAGGVPRQSLGGKLSQSQSLPSSHAPGGKSQGLTYLVAQHKTSQVLQAEALVTGSLTLRPTGMQSETHRMLVKAVGQRHNKVARLRMADEEKMAALERENLDSIKTARRSASRRDIFGSHKRRRSSRKETEDSDPDGFDSDDDMPRRSSGHKKRARTDEDGRTDYQADGFVVSDEEDDSDEDRRRSLKEDDLDRLDALAERQSKRSGVNSGDADEPMDVESEEADDEPKVRRPGGSRRKRAMYDDPEEED